MGRMVVYNGSGKNLASTQVLVEGKKYEIISETLDGNPKMVQLKGISGEFDASLFDETKEGMVLDTKVMKPAYLAKVTLQREDIKSYIGSKLILKILYNKKLKVRRTSKVQRIENIYGNIYKVETNNSVYITEVIERTVG